MNGSYLSKLLKLNAHHALYREDGMWYHNLKKFPGVLFDRNGYVIFHAENNYLNHPLLQIRKDLHINGGISTLSDYQLFTTYQRNLIAGIDFNSETSYQDSNEIIRVLREVNTILRKKSLVDKLKKIYDNTCQICGTRIALSNNRFYSEAHHIVPLGQPHNGKDRLDNMICVCPNHHVQLDLKAILLRVDTFHLIKHDISSEYIQQHNSLVSTFHGV